MIMEVDGTEDPEDGAAINSVQASIQHRGQHGSK